MIAQLLIQPGKLSELKFINPISKSAAFRFGGIYDLHLPIELFLHYIRWKSSRMSCFGIHFIKIRELGFSIGSTIEQPYVTLGIEGYQIGFAW